MMNLRTTIVVCVVCATHLLSSSTAFTLTMMGGRRGKGNLKKSLDPSYVGGKGISSSGGVSSLNGGRGQEITGVTMPEQGKIRGWAFGDDKTIACANVDGKFYAVDGRCPRCAFDLYKGRLLVDTDVWGKGAAWKKRSSFAWFDF
eukprot:CCRYP_012708-RA/>CCRYP_012708-RA protein AED:0.09 eAED:0.09 QI:157/1/1/1/1/1/4/516/144